MKDFAVVILGFGFLAFIINTFSDQPFIVMLAVALILFVIFYKPLSKYVKQRGTKTSDVREDPYFEQRQREVLTIARRYNGLVTQSDVTLESELSLDEAKSYLEYFVQTGIAKLRIADNGAYVYEFLELLSEKQKQQAESF